MSDLGEIIRRRQDQLRGRPRDWRDDLRDWHRRFDLWEFVWRVYIALVLSYFTGCVVLVWFVIRMLTR